MSLAKLHQTNASYVAKAEKILLEHPTFVAEIKSGVKSISQVAREIKRQEAQARLCRLPTDKFRVIYADPPWQYGNAGLESYGAAEDHYPTMPTSEICRMDIRSLCEDDAVLFLWATSPLLEDAFQVVKAWGFQYKTCFVWDKVRHNFGHFCSVRHEFLLVCTRGSCTPDSKKLYDSVQTIERTGHSVKPEEFRGIIDDLYEYGKRIELFARKKVEGWEAFGNEV